MTSHEAGNDTSMREHDSMSATRFLARLRDVFQVELPLDSLFEQGRIANQREERLGLGLAAHRPQARAAPSAQDDGVDFEVRFHGRGS